MQFDRRRAAVAIVADGRVAVIKRQAEDRVWYLLPGGGVEDGETFEEAAAREALEELGVTVRVGPFLAEVRYTRGDGRWSQQRYFAAEITGGRFGTGDGPEYLLPPDSPRGTYEPMWLALDGATEHDLRPPELFRRLAAEGTAGLARDPLVIEERRG
jgi:8-oxo-dGTP diphosphatase